MTDRLPSELELADIDARHQAATPGPWERYEDYGPNFFANTTGPYLRGVGDFDFGVGEQAEADEEFVRHAAADVGVLLAALRRAHAERDRYRNAWQSARSRAEAHGEGILRVVKDREAWQGWLKQAEARITELEGAASPFTDSERAMLTYALDQAQERIWSEDGFTDEDQAAVDSLRARADAPSRPVTARVGLSPASEAAGDGRGAETAPQDRVSAAEAPGPHTTPQSAPQGRTGATEEAR